MFKAIHDAVGHLMRFEIFKSPVEGIALGSGLSVGSAECGAQAAGFMIASDAQ